MIDAIPGLVREALAFDKNINNIVGHFCLGVPGIILGHVIMPLPDNTWVLLGVLLPVLFDGMLINEIRTNLTK